MKFADIDKAKELADLAREIWMDYFPKIIDKDETEYILNTFQSESAIRKQIEEGYLYSFIIENEEKAGYFCIRPENDELFISKIYVSEKYRGKGLGSKTMDDILQKGRAMKLKKAYLRVNRNNALAIDVYKHKGFIIAKEEKLDIGDGFCMDDFLMEYIF